MIFLDMDSGVREHLELVKKYFGTIIPYNDNKFAALNSAVWSGGSFIYVPPGVRIDVPLQAYFRINAENMGQFERTLIIVDKDAYVHYVEGCTAPTYTTNSLHSAVEIVVLEGGRCRYTTIQNWSKNVYNLVTKRAAAYKNATMEWVDGNLGSKVTMKYPAVWLMEEARGEILSVAFASDGQHQDAGGKVVHVAPRTSSQIISKSISKGTGRSSYRGLVKVYKGAEEVRSNVVCDALLLDETSKTDTYPYIEVEEERASIGHEATVSKVAEEQIFYLMSRGLSEDEAMSMIVNGFIEPIAKELPLEYAVELNRLIQLEMEGPSVIRKSDERGAAALRSPRSSIGDHLSMSTIAEVSDLAFQRGRRDSRGKVSKPSRGHASKPAPAATRMRAWELYESLPMPTRTDEEWRRTDLRGLKLDRLRPAAGVDDPGIAPLQALEEAGVEDAAAQIALGPNAGVIVQRDASTILTTLDPEVAAKGVIFTDLATAYREHPELVKRYFMTQAVQPSLGKFQALHAAFWQEARSSMSRRA